MRWEACLAQATAGMKAIDDRTFEIALKEPFPLMVTALARPSSIPALHDAQARGRDVGQ